MDKTCTWGITSIRFICENSTEFLFSTDTLIPICPTHEAYVTRRHARGKHSFPDIVCVPYAIRNRKQQKVCLCKWESCDSVGLQRATTLQSLQILIVLYTNTAVCVFNRGRETMCFQIDYSDLHRQNWKALFIPFIHNFFKINNPIQRQET